MKNFLLLSAAYLSGPRLNGTGKANEALHPFVSNKKKPRATIVQATGGPGKSAGGVDSRTQRKSPLNAGGKV